MQTEKTKIDTRFGKEYEGTYTFAEISWAKRNRIIQKHTRYNKLSGDIESSDFIAIQAETIIASLHDQPQSHPITLERLLAEEKGIPIGLGELFSKIVNKLNGLSREDLRFLLEQLDEENRTDLLSSLGYVKLSVGLQQNLQNNQQEQSKSSVKY